MRSCRISAWTATPRLQSPSRIGHNVVRAYPNTSKMRMWELDAPPFLSGAGCLDRLFLCSCLGTIVSRDPKCASQESWIFKGKLLYGGHKYHVARILAQGTDRLRKHPSAPNQAAHSRRGAAELVPGRARSNDC